MLKRTREILNKIKTNNLHIVESGTFGAGNYKFLLKAPNGAQHLFVFMKTPDGGTAKGEWRALEKFAEANQLTAMQVAIAKASVNGAMQEVPVGPRGSQPSRALLNGLAVVQHVKEKVESQIMDTKVSPPAKAHAPIRKISQVDFFRLCQWVTRHIEDNSEITQAEIARRAGEDLKIIISAASIPAALEATGKKINSPAAKGGAFPYKQNMAILAKAMLVLAGKDGLPADLMQQLREIAQ